MVPFFARAATCLSLLLSLFANATSAAAQDGNRMVTIEVVAPNEAWLGEVFEIEDGAEHDLRLVVELLERGPHAGVRLAVAGGLLGIGGGVGQRLVGDAGHGQPHDGRVDDLGVLARVGALGGHRGAGRSAV